MKNVEDLKVKEFKLDIRVCNLLLLKSNDWVILIEKTNRLRVLTKKGIENNKYSEVKQIYSTYEAKQKSETLDILKENNEDIDFIQNGILYFKEGKEVPYEDYILRGIK